jgi:transposase-like protein
MRRSTDHRRAWDTASIMPVTNAIERLHEEFKRRIKTQCLLPCAETAAMLFWALLASAQITMRRVDGWPTLDRSPTGLDLAA